MNLFFSKLQATKKLSAREHAIIESALHGFTVSRKRAGCMYSWVEGCFWKHLFPQGTVGGGTLYSVTSSLFSLSSSTIYVRMHEAMNELAPGNHIKMTKSEEGSGRGAAIVAAVASRLNK